MSKVKPVVVISVSLGLDNTYVRRVLSQSYSDGNDNNQSLMTINQFADLIGDDPKNINVIANRNKLSVVYPFMSKDTKGPKFILRDQRTLDLLNSKHGTEMKLPSDKIEDVPQAKYNEEFITRFNNMRNAYRKSKGLRSKPLTISKKTNTQLKSMNKAGVKVSDLIRASMNAYKSKYHDDTNGKFIMPEFITRQDKYNMYVDSSEVD
jgi:hypothetical protein